jgi:hypothetical protein
MGKSHEVFTFAAPARSYRQELFWLPLECLLPQEDDSGLHAYLLASSSDVKTHTINRSHRCFLSLNSSKCFGKQDERIAVHVLDGAYCRADRVHRCNIPRQISSPSPRSHPHIMRPTLVSPLLRCGEGLVLFKDAEGCQQGAISTER